MKGWKTIIVNGVALLVALAAGFGYDISGEDQAALAAGVIAAVNIVLRFVTSTPVFNRAD